MESAFRLWQKLMLFLTINTNHSQVLLYGYEYTCMALDYSHWITESLDYCFFELVNYYLPMPPKLSIILHPDPPVLPKLVIVLLNHPAQIFIYFASSPPVLPKIFNYFAYKPTCSAHIFILHKD